jgi:hypothetical protein
MEGDGCKEAMNKADKSTLAKKARMGHRDSFQRDKARPHGKPVFSESL